jgi:hypothetical protein
MKIRFNRKMRMRKAKPNNQSEAKTIRNRNWMRMEKDKSNIEKETKMN